MKIRTSETDPLGIAEMPVGVGTVGVTLCPGKRATAFSVTGWARDLATDLAVIRDWGASAVVTLIEEHEFEMLGVESLPEAIRAAGIEWHHLPVTDVSAPTTEFETRWVYAGARLRERLRGGRARAGALPRRARARGVGGGAAAGGVRRGAGGGHRAGAGGAAGRHRDPRAGAVGARAAGGRCERADARAVAASWLPARRCDRRCVRVPGGVRFAGDDPGRVRAAGACGWRGGGVAGGVGRHADDALHAGGECFKRDARAEPLVEAIRQAYLDWYRTQRGRWHARSDEGSGLLRARGAVAARAPGKTCLSALRRRRRGQCGAADQRQQGMRRRDAHRADRVSGRRGLRMTRRLRTRGRSRGAHARSSGRLCAVRCDGARGAQADRRCIVDRGDRGGR